MFTGIVEATAEVMERTSTGLTVERLPLFTDVKIGSSIAVSGACLTVVDLDTRRMRFDVVPETWAKTTLGNLKSSDRVNLERAMAGGGRFEGHVVQGHVEGIGEVTSFQFPVSREEDTMLTIRLPDELSRYVIPKGSIAIDGVSLTVASIEQNICTVALIPHTLTSTTLGVLREGDYVNIETDMIVRAVASLLPPHA